MSFLSTLSLRRATGGYGVRPLCNLISIHALLAESDRDTYKLYLEVINFYPRSPCGERLCSSSIISCSIIISIHALLAESDVLTNIRNCS